MCYSGGTYGVLVGYEEVSVQETGGKSPNADCNGVGGSLEEEALGIALWCFFVVQLGWCCRWNSQKAEADVAP